MLSAVAFCVGIFILIYGFYGSINDIKGSELLCVLSSGLMIIFLYKVLKTFPNTWIKYDKDTIIISQISSKYENGKKQKKEVTLNVKNIRKYGFSFELLQENIEWDFSCFLR